MHNNLITLRNKTKNALTEETQKYLREIISQFVDLTDLIAYNEIWNMTFSNSGLIFRFREYNFNSEQIRIIRNELAFQYRNSHPDWKFCKLSALEISDEAKGAISTLQKALGGDEIATAVAVEHCITYFNTRSERIALLSKVNYLLNYGNTENFIVGGLNALGFYREACKFFIPVVREIGAVFYFIVKEKIDNYDYFSRKIISDKEEETSTLEKADNELHSENEETSSYTASPNSSLRPIGNSVQIVRPSEGILDLYEMCSCFIKPSISPVLLI